MASVLLSVITTALVLLFPDWRSAIRTFLGFVVVMLLPGYAFQALMFPRKGDVDGIERVALTLGMSIVALPMLGLLLNYTPWGIRTAPIALGLTGIVIALASLGIWRRAGIGEDAFFLDAREVEVRRGLVAFALSVAVIGAVPSLTLALRPSPNDTEFYVLGADGRLEGYPRTLSPGQPFRLTFGVTNRGKGPQSFVIRFAFATKPERVVVPMLPPGGTWQQPVTLTAPSGQGRTTLGFDLYAAGHSTVQRHLMLLVNLGPVSAANAAAQTGTSGSTAPTAAAHTDRGRAGATPGATYVVRPGDTIYSIARMFYGDGSSYLRIVDANRERLSDPRDLPVGLQLRIPPP